MKGEWVYRTIAILMLGALGWFVKGTYDEQRLFNKQVDSRLGAIEINQAKAEAARFTAAEWLAAKNIIDASLANQDKRITRTEDAIIVLKETLPRMEKKLDDLGESK